ncbi:8859_t:CDS:10 [Funneliformis geosporum]|uniref:8859_t:CDS:1 n=1 Tax=Funneliformis geosporum TaxID=1117311 RepID=A0A9W4WQC2_9GLOM|nr:8859_t:CDS:10 [Funneliformis geosporum]
MDYLKSISRVVLGKDIPSFPYNIGEKIEAFEGLSIWSLHNGTKKEDGSSVSVFTFDCNKQKERLQLAKNAFKKFRTIRHPDLLRYLDGVETDTFIYIVTEYVSPLKNQLRFHEDNNLKLWGLYKVGSALKFLNDDCSIIHGNVRISSIFTNKAGEWMLAGFELMSSMKEENPMYGGLVVESAKYASPEVLKSSWNILKDQEIWVIDSWNYGILIYEVYNGEFTSTKQLDNINLIPQNMRDLYSQLVATNPKQRLSISSFIEDGLRPGGFFQNDLVQINLFLENMNIKESREKDLFFKHVSRGARVLPPIIKIGNTLDDTEYEQLIITAIIKMFAVPDRTIRLSLLENLGSFIDKLSNKIINDQIFQHVATGFTDTAPIIRESTVKSILLIVPKLYDRTINNDLLKYLAKLQMDEEPGIRTNTTICLGKISKHLNDSTKKKVLVPAFTRSLRDPFPHARVASLMALAATSEYYDATECATKVLPCVSLVLVDKERPVRTQAFKTADIFIKRLEKLAESMPDTAIPDPNSTENSSVAGSVAGVAVSVAESWAGWAVTSITKKIAGSGVEGEITAQSSSDPPTSVTIDTPHTLTKNKIGSGHLSPILNSSLVDQADHDTSNVWENEDHLVTVDNLNMKVNNDWAHPTDGWDLDDSDWGNGEGWDNNWNSSRPLSTASSKSTSSIQKSSNTPNVLSKEEKAVELNKKREERKQRMAELREQKKKSNGLGAKKI